MPTLKAKPKFKPDDLVIALETFSGSDGRISFGDRVRADNPWVARIGADKFVLDGTPSDEIERLRQQLNRPVDVAPIEQPARTRVEKRIDDADAMVQVTGFGVGTRAHKKAKIVNSGIGKFVPVVPDPSLDRRDALVATATMSIIGDDGEPMRVVYAGQWVSKDDPLVEIHPHSFTLPHVAVREEA